MRKFEETQEVRGKPSTGQRFFISSLSPIAERIAFAVRLHWLIGNGLHGTPNIVFNEDQSRS